MELYRNKHPSAEDGTSGCSTRGVGPILPDVVEPVSLDFGPPQLLGFGSGGNNSVHIMRQVTVRAEKTLTLAFPRVASASDLSGPLVNLRASGLVVPR